MNIQKGFRDKIDKYADANGIIEVCIDAEGAFEFDYVCFGLDADGKLADDRFMVFFNQTSSPNGEIKYELKQRGAVFSVNLSKLPTTINKLAFTVNIDGVGTMGQINALNALLNQNNKNFAKFDINGNAFKNEKAVVVIELYKKDGWRFSAVASGFDGGLSDLLKFYGGEEITIAAPDKPSQMQKVSAMRQGVPTKPVILKKGQKVSLTKNMNNEPIIIENGWVAKGKDYDLKALVRYRDGRRIYVGAANIDESLSTPEGAVRHGGDIKFPGELERIYIKWHPEIASVAVSSYSALENGAGSFKRYGVYVRIKNGSQIVEIPAADISANDYSYTLCFGEILFDQAKDAMDVEALEIYSASGSEHRIRYKNGKVVMDIGPVGKMK